MCREIVIDTCVLTATSREGSEHVVEALEFIEKVIDDIENCHTCICVDCDNKILDEYDRYLNEYGKFLIQRAIEKKKIKYIKANTNHPVCKESIECAPELKEDIVFIAVSIRTSDKILFTDDTQFFEPCGEERIHRDKEGIPIPISPLKKVNLRIYDLESREKAFFKE